MDEDVLASGMHISFVYSGTIASRSYACIEVRSQKIKDRPVVGCEKAVNKKATSAI